LKITEPGQKPVLVDLHAPEHAVDHLTENQGPIAPTRPRSVYFDVVVEAKKSAGKNRIDTDKTHDDFWLKF
jgi:hypothetical protein